MKGKENEVVSNKTESTPAKSRITSKAFKIISGEDYSTVDEPPKENKLKSQRKEKEKETKIEEDRTAEVEVNKSNKIKNKNRIEQIPPSNEINKEEYKDKNESPSNSNNGAMEGIKNIIVKNSDIPGKKENKSKNHKCCYIY